MATIVYGMNVSLDGYVDHLKLPAPDAELFRHWTDHVRGLAGNLYGRLVYEDMRYWDEDHADWTPALHDFATAWRALPKFVVSRTLTEVGPNATLMSGDLEGAVRDLKARLPGEISVAGPTLAQSLTDLGLVDEYRLYLHPVVLGAGKRFFAGPRPPLRLVGSERIGGGVVRVRYGQG